MSIVSRTVGHFNSLLHKLLILFTLNCITSSFTLKDKLPCCLYYSKETLLLPAMTFRRHTKMVSRANILEPL